MLVTILAVTKTSNDRFCIAGLDEDGDWVRPIFTEDPNARFWPREQLMISDEFVKSGDVWEIKGRQPTILQYPNHVEDYVVTKRSFSRSLNNNQLIKFLRTHSEDVTVFNDTVMGQGRSLCLVKIRSFRTEVFYNKPKLYLTGDNFSLDNPHVRFNNYIIKDCKWSGLVMQDYHQWPKFSEVYACIGLATQWNGTEYPQLIGLHTNPDIPCLPSYPDD